MFENEKKVGSLVSDKYIEKSLQRANKGNVRGFFDIKFVSNSDGLMTYEICLLYKSDAADE